MATSRSFEIKDKKGETIVEVGRRITARHVRLLEKSGLRRLDVPREYLVDRVIARDIVNQDTGEILLPCNAIITEEVLDKLLRGRRFDDRDDLHERTRLRSVHFRYVAHRSRRARASKRSSKSIG